MDANTFCVHGEVLEQVRLTVSKLVLPKTESGGYTHDDVRIFERQVERVLNGQFYAAEDGERGMKSLLSGMSNALTKIKSNKTASRASVLLKSKRAAEAKSTVENPAAPDITSNNDAREEADRQNMFILAVIGARYWIL